MKSLAKQRNPTEGRLHPAKELRFGKSQILNLDCISWLQGRSENSIHAVVTDPPFGIREYNENEKKKLRIGKGGVWRIPPSFDGCRRMPLPRFTTLSRNDIDYMHRFFSQWAKLIYRCLVPGGHILIATNPMISHHVYQPIIQAGFEKRGEIVRLVQTLRGGDRPKNAHLEYKDVTVMPRSAWEPWGLFRKPLDGTVRQCLEKWGTGGLRRISPGRPFTDVVLCSPTHSKERSIANHPSLKPQSFMRQIVRASLPLGRGVVLDPFLGGGSTIAAALSLGYDGIGLELDPEYFDGACASIPLLRDYKTPADLALVRGLRGRSAKGTAIPGAR